MDIEEVLHPAVCQREPYHRFGLLGNGGLWPIGTHSGAWQVEEAWIVQDFRWWHDGVTGAHVDLQRNPNVAEHDHELDAHAAVLLVPADRFDVNAIRQERQAVVR
jgi:hypothetical protein